MYAISNKTTIPIVAVDKKGKVVEITEIRLVLKKPKHGKAVVKELTVKLK